MTRAIIALVILLLESQTALADAALQECLGRIKFQTTERFDWATFRIESRNINSPGGHTFSKKISAVGDFVRYDYDELTIRISDITSREIFDRARNAIVYDVELYKEELKNLLKTDRQILENIKHRNYPASVVKETEKRIENLERQIQKTNIHGYELGLADAYVLGSERAPYEILLWRNNRVFYFHMNKPTADSAQRIKDLIARFEPRELYQVPEGPGVCMPYGFIHDDGKTGFSVKNSLRFTSTPNVIMSMINASPDDPSGPTRGTYNTNYSPGYDAEKWKKSKIMEKFFFGNRMTTLEGWRLDPRPGSGEQERAWFAIAHVGGLVRPLLAVQMFTFQKGTDDLKDLTPPPEAVIPRFLKLTQSIREQ